MQRQITSRSAQHCVIPLDQAWYCESCHVITNDETCCTCASHEHNQRLDLWLDREREPIKVPRKGVYLAVIPDSRKGPVLVPQRAPRAS
jgi:hypothetical protein